MMKKMGVLVRLLPPTDGVEVLLMKMTAVNKKQEMMMMMTMVAHRTNLYPAQSLSTAWCCQSLMALGEKLFEESGKIVGFKVTRVHPVEGTTMEVSFTSEIKGFGKFPSGRNIGSGIMTQYPHGAEEASFQGTMMTTAEGEGEQWIWWAHEKSKVAEGGKIKGIVIISGFTNSQKLSWMNNLVVAGESEFDPATQQFRVTGYEWI